MRPPFSITPKILSLISQIERLIGRVESLDQPKPQPKLRKSNRVKTLQGSLAIEGNSLSVEQVTALLEGKRVLAPKNEILEILENRSFSRKEYMGIHKSISTATASRDLKQGVEKELLRMQGDKATTCYQFL